VLSTVYAAVAVASIVAQPGSALAATIVVRAPSAPLTALSEKAQVLVVASEEAGTVATALWAPESATQFVPVSVATVSVSATPLLAYKVGPTRAVPEAPENHRADDRRAGPRSHSGERLAEQPEEKRAAD